MESCIEVVLFILPRFFFLQQIDYGFRVNIPLQAARLLNRRWQKFMSEREQAKQIIDQLPEYKIGNLLLFLKGMQFDDDLEDELYCPKLYEEYLNDTDSDKHKTITIEELAAREGIEL